jgi:hypothetical protein
MNLSRRLWHYVTLVVPPEQVELYQEAFPDVHITPCDAYGIGPTRQFILHMRNTGKVIMIDDDLAFYQRLSDSKFARIQPYEIEATERMIGAMFDLLDRYPMVGLVDKAWSHLTPREFKECTRFNDIHGYNRDLFPDPWPAFRVPHDEEHDVHLQFLTRGIKTAVSTEFSKMSKSDRPGGCSDWRNQQVLDEAHNLLKQYWGGIVDPGPRHVKYKWKEAMRQGGIDCG